MNAENGAGRPPVATPLFDVSDCAAEPIHIPGAIQPHGAFVALLAKNGLITHASANLEDYCGISPHTAFELSASKLFGDEMGRSIFEACEGTTTAPELHPARARDGTLIHLHGFRSGAYFCIDIEPVRGTVRQESLLDVAQSIAEPMREAADRVELCELAVSGLKRALGYDRIMAYRFAADGHGEVIAEAREPHLESYLGLRYPASDIPPQARLLYMRNPVGAIVDSSYTAVPLIVEARGHPPLDLTMSTLRSASPIHREFMRNMGTAASLTIGLPGREGLWGMLVCHHATPRIPGPGHRAIAAIVGQVVSLLLQTIGIAEGSAERLERSSLLRTLVRRLSAPLPLMDAIRAAEGELLGVVGATGALVTYEGEVAVLGVIPPLASAQEALATLLADAEDGFLAVDDLGLRHPDLAACTEAGSGALIISRRNETTDSVLWFRPEIRQTVKWGGKPSDQGHTKDGRISPRTSFAAWSETVSGHAQAWSEVDLAMARELSFAIYAEVGRRAKAELARLRHYDPLTGLPNRSLLDERLAKLQDDEPVSLLFFDLDRFKSVNDTFGHTVGDALLIEVARRVRDVIGTLHFAARLGGDEFVILGRMDPREAMRVAQAIGETVAVPFDIGGKTCNVAASIGVASAGQCGRLSLVQAADMAMYASKQGGGNRATLFETSMYERAARELELQQDLRTALANDQLLLLYQPVYSLAQGGSAIVGFEALLRWNHPRLGLMSPDQVIPLAEKLGLIAPLGRWVLEQAVGAGGKLQKAFPQGLSISVNVSALELLDEAYRTHLHALLQTRDYAPATLCLEVTEDTLRDAAALAVLEDLQGLGIRIAIDEFGIGYSSLSYLRRLPVNVVKLDGSFLANVDGDKRAFAFISAVIALAHAAGMSVVVEGVETQSQFEIATNAGADMAQGFKLAPPLTLEAALAQAKQT